MAVKDWTQVLLLPDAPLRRAIEVLDAAALQICLVVDGGQRLLGTVTDGDVRRAILRHVSMEAPVSTVMNPSPRHAPAASRREERLHLLATHHLKHLPLLDAQQRVVGLATLEELVRDHQRRANACVILAGGRGTRLRPLTENTPKPMLTVGGRPLLERLVDMARRSGLTRIFLAVNYLAEQIEAHFGDGRAFGVEITYLREDHALGTAGPLGLLPEPPTQAVLVMNGDLLMDVDLGRMLDQHEEGEAAATMAVRGLEFTNPFGIVIQDQGRITDIQEKPVHQFLINAGLYVLGPEAVARVPAGAALDMPDLFRNLMADGLRTEVFPLREYWLDIGRLNDYHQALDDVKRLDERRLGVSEADS